MFLAGKRALVEGELGHQEVASRGRVSIFARETAIAGRLGVNVCRMPAQKARGEEEEANERQATAQANRTHVRLPMARRGEGPG